MTDRLKTTFIVEDGVYAYNRMSFDLCNAQATFQRIILHIFNKMSVGNFKAFLDNWPIFNAEDKHLTTLKECMERQMITTSTKLEEVHIYGTAGETVGTHHM